MELELYRVEPFYFVRRELYAFQLEIDNSLRLGRYVL